MEKKVLHNQTILDISIQETGTVENCFQIAISNGRSVSDDLVSGVSLLDAEVVKKDEDILTYFRAKKITTATGVIDEINIPELGGIGYMKIGGNFKIS